LRSLYWKLAIILVLIVIISIGLTAFLIGQSTTREFQQYVSRCNAIYVDSIVDNLSSFYSKNQNWTDVGVLLDSEITGSCQRLILADSSGVVLADTSGQWQGQVAGKIGLTDGIPVNFTGKLTGTLYAVCTSGNGQGQMMGQNCMNPSAYSIAEQDFLNQVNNYLWIAGLIAAGIALLIGLLFARQITMPIKHLKAGAQKIASGDLEHRVIINSKDELGELAASFNSMASGLDKLEQSRRRLTADIAHELRTSLTIINGTVDGVLDGVFQPDREHLGWIKEQITLLTRLIDDLRDLSLAESGQLKLNLTSIDLEELIRRKILQISKLAEDKDIKLELKISEKLPLINADSSRLEQVMSNLIKNAIRHTPGNGKIEIEVKTTDYEANDLKIIPGIMISVADTGEGIPTEHISHIFERFYRVENSRLKEGGETGLGLAIVKQMVEAHGGRVWVESEPGRGSIFYVVIPYQAN
jgi:signal transduction histidine kinase